MKVIKIEQFDNSLPSKFINNDGLKVVVVNIQIATKLQEMSEYFAPDFNNNIEPGKIYYFGMCGGHYIYVDPNLAWNNNVIILCNTLEEYDNK